ncbi:MAG: cytochrome b/b6 domain-containing protein [Bryobacteraceae bacterium]
MTKGTNRNMNADFYPRWLRAWHWSNAVLFAALLATGASMHFAEPGAPQVDFRTARFVHNTAGILLTLGYLIFLVRNTLSGNGRYYLPEGDDLGAGILRQVRYYLVGIFRGDPHPYHHIPGRKFNPMQKLTYLGLMYLVFPGIVVTGWLMFFPEKMPERIDGLPGAGAVSLAHAIIGYALALFLVVHIYLGTTGSTPLALFREMISGAHAETPGENTPAA